MNKIYFSFLLTLTMIISSDCCVFSQQYLQLETKYDVESKKFPLGKTILMKVEGSDFWEKITPTKFDYTNNVIVHKYGQLSLSDILVIRQHRQEVSILSTSLMAFGLTWLGFGILSGEILKKNQESGYKDLIIGTSSLAIGYGVQKAFYNRDFHIGDKYRLRLLDLRISIN